MINAIRRPLLNVRMLGRLIGLLLGIEAAFMLVPLAVSLFYGESDWKSFGIAICATLCASVLLSRLSNPRSSYMGKREGFLLTASVWIVFSLFGMLPFLWCEHPLGITDAFFEAMSGFTTTGAYIFSSSSGLSHGLHIWRALMQWVGGMGIILFTLAVIPSLNHSGGMQMFNAEVTGVIHDKVSPRISQTAMALWGIYLGLTLLLIALLWVGPMDLFDSICHAFGTVSTGGYTMADGDLGQYSGSVYVKVVLTVFMFLGGVNFALICKAIIRKSGSPLALNEVFRVYVGAVLVLTLIFIIDICVNTHVNSWNDITVEPLFHVVSTMTSTGMTAGSLSSWGPVALALTLVMMYSGACAGSTSGGAKIDRMMFVVKHIRNEITRCLNPNAILPVKVNGKVVSPDVVSKVASFMAIYVIVIVIAGVVLTILGMPVFESFVASFSCISNTGLGASFENVGGDYGAFPEAAKWVLSGLMLTGRLEIYTIMVLLTPSFWRR